MRASDGAMTIFWTTLYSIYVSTHPPHGCWKIKLTLAPSRHFDLPRPVFLSKYGGLQHRGMYRSNERRHRVSVDTPAMCGEWTDARVSLDRFICHINGPLPAHPFNISLNGSLLWPVSYPCNTLNHVCVLVLISCARICILYGCETWTMRTEYNSQMKDGEVDVWSITHLTAQPSTLRLRSHTFHGASRFEKLLAPQ